MQISQRSPSNYVTSNDDNCRAGASQRLRYSLSNGKQNSISLIPLDAATGHRPITSRSKEANLVSCHVIPLDTDGRTLTQLSYAWGINWRLLDLTSPSNTLLVDEQWREQFSKHQWFLFPEPDIIHSISKLIEGEKDMGVRKVHEYFAGQTSFKYYVIPWPALKSEFTTIFGPLLPGRAHIVHAYPFDTLGPIISHVKPHFVIWSMYLQFRVNSGMDTHPLLHNIQAALKRHQPDPTGDIHSGKLTMEMYKIYRHWMSRRVPSTFTQCVCAPRRSQSIYREIYGSYTGSDESQASAANNGNTLSGCVSLSTS